MIEHLIRSIKEMYKNAQRLPNNTLHIAIPAEYYIHSAVWFDIIENALFSDKPLEEREDEMPILLNKKIDYTLNVSIQHKNISFYGKVDRKPFAGMFQPFLERSNEEPHHIYSGAVYHDKSWTLAYRKIPENLDRAYGKEIDYYWYYFHHSPASKQTYVTAPPHVHKSVLNDLVATVRNIIRSSPIRHIYYELTKGRIVDDETLFINYTREPTERESLLTHHMRELLRAYFLGGDRKESLMRVLELLEK